MSNSFVSEENSSRKKTLMQSIKHSQNSIAISLSEGHAQDLQQIVDGENSTLLHVAANSNNYEMAEYYLNAYDKLIKEKPDKYSLDTKSKWLQMKDNEGFSCLHYSVFRGNFKLAQLFQKNGADIYQINHQGLTVVHIAAQGDSPLLMYYYLNKGLKIGVTDSKGSTPLHWACYSGQENAASALISWGAEIDKQQFTFGMTPLHLSVMSGNGRIVKKLLLKGCDRNIRAFNGKLALDLALQNEYKNIAEMIIDKQGIEELMNIKTPFRKLHKKTFPFYLLLVLFTICYTLNISFVIRDTIISEQILTIIFLVFGFFVIVMFAISSYSNPGYLCPYQGNNFIKSEQKNMYQILTKYKSHQICFDCRIVKPQRSRHCQICNSCISVYDHHCPWIANCVGANNYWAFFTFLISMFLFMIFTIAFQIVNLADTKWNDHHSLQIIRIICQFFSLVIAVFFILPLMFLIIVQIKNIVQNKTTFERYGFQKSSSQNASARSSMTSRSTYRVQQSRSQELRLRLVDTSAISISAERSQGSSLYPPREEQQKFNEESISKNCFAMFCGNRKNIRYQVGI